jgi:hypothetical protein
MKTCTLALIFLLAILVHGASAGADTCNATVSEMRKLVGELREFEDTPGFALYGFGGRGPYHKWLERAKSLQERTQGMDFISSLASDDVAVPGDIIGWGFEKMICASRKGNCDHDFIEFVEGQLRGTKCKEN